VSRHLLQQATAGSSHTYTSVGCKVQSSAPPAPAVAGPVQGVAAPVVSVTPTSQLFFTCPLHHVGTYQPLIVCTPQSHSPVRITSAGVRKGQLGHRVQEGVDTCCCCAKVSLVLQPFVRDLALAAENSFCAFLVWGSLHGVPS
jgi:hypothetical protein